MQELTMTIMVEDDQVCEECQAPIFIDVDKIQIRVGVCRCGEEIYLSPDENYEWGTLSS